jgi:hypothetical protein
MLGSEPEIIAAMFDKWKALYSPLTQMSKKADKNPTPAQ